jgi:glycosyltransferase involved in cell wall biosynthesis
MKIDLIICTHNPRWDYLIRTLDSILQQQSIAGVEVEQWLVDNNSPPECSEKLKSICAERGFQYLFEKEPGLVHARICGLRNTSGEVIVWVDDDTVLAPNFLSEVARIVKEKPFLGVWGGNVILELEKSVPDYIRPHLALLTENCIEIEEWSNYRHCMPVAGAGMCTRRVVGDRYIANFDASPLRKLLGRSANNLFSGEDWDFCQTAPEIGLGVGRMPNLSLTHLIPERRTTEAYLLKIAEGHKFSAQIVLAIRGIPLVDDRLDRKILALRLRQLLKPSFAKRVLLAEYKGFKKGLEFVQNECLRQAHIASK